MGVSKWKANMALGKAASATAEAAGTLVYANAESFNIESANAETAERVNAITREPLAVDAYGMERNWTIDGCEGDATFWGFLFYAFLGATAYTPGTPDTHVQTYADDPPYINVKLDDVLDKGSSVPTESLLAGRIGRISMALDMKSFARATISGIGSTLASAGAALSATLNTGDDNAALSWKALQDASGFIKLGYNGAGSAAATKVTGLAFEFAQELEPLGVDLDNDDPSDTGVGAVSIEATVSYLNSGAATDTARKMYDAHEAHQRVELDVKGVMGTHSVRIHLPAGRIIGPLREPVGAGADAQVASATIRFYQNASSELCTVTTEDETFGGAYSA